MDTVRVRVKAGYGSHFLPDDTEVTAGDTAVISVREFEDFRDKFELVDDLGLVELSVEAEKLPLPPTLTALLSSAGLDTADSIKDASDKEILSIKGIGEKALEMIRSEVG